MSGIKIPVEAALDGGSAEAVLREFTAKFNALGHQIASLNKVKFAPVDKASLDHVKQLEAGFSSLLKVSTELNKRLKATGQGGAGLLDVDWKKLYPDQHVQARQMLKAFQYVTGGRAFSPLPGSPAAPAAPQPAVQPPQPAQPRPGAQPPGIMQRVASAGLGAAGLGGGAEGVMGGAGMGFGAMLAGGIGAIAALGVGKLIGAVRAKVGNAEQELIGYDTLKRTLGDVNVSFDMLRSSLRETARGLDVTFNESQKLGLQFAKMSGAGPEGARGLAEEVGAAGGFGRSFGLDPSQAVGFFAQQRLYGTTKGVEDSRRLGLLIGEGIARAGAFAKVDEVLQAVAGFTEQQTRMGMVPANVGGYMGMFASMAGSGIPGTDPASTAALLARINSSIAGGGSAGEAGQNFLFSAIGSRLGLDPLQAQILREQGAFGTGRATFGPRSPYAQFAKQYGAQVPGMAAGSTATNLQMVLEHFGKVYSGRPELMVNAMSSLFGGSMSQSMALATINKQYGSATLGGLAKRLQDLGININDVSASGISRLAQLHVGGGSDAQIRAAASSAQEETEGSRTRATISGVERAVQKAAALLVEPLNDIRAGIMYIAGEYGGGSPRKVVESIAKADSEDRLARIDSEYEGRMSRASSSRVAAKRAQQELLQRNLPLLKSGKMTQAEHAAQMAPLLEQERRAMQADTDARSWRDQQRSAEEQRLEGQLKKLRRPPGMEEAMSAEGVGSEAMAMEGLSADQARLAMAMYGQESSNGTNAGTSSAGAMGPMQMMPATFKAFADPGWDINNPEHNRRASYRYLKYLWAKAGGNARTVAGAYYAGEKAIGPGGTLKEYRDLTNPAMPTSLEHADKVMERMRNLPDVRLDEDEARRSRQEAFRREEIRLSATVQVVDQQGRPIAAPAEMKTATGRPVPMGAGG